MHLLKKKIDSSNNILRVSEILSQNYIFARIKNKLLMQKLQLNFINPEELEIFNLIYFENDFKKKYPLNSHKLKKIIQDPSIFNKIILSFLNHQVYGIIIDFN
jgi:hypothetical protein